VTSYVLNSVPSSRAHRSLLPLKSRPVRRQVLSPSSCHPDANRDHLQLDDVDAITRKCLPSANFDLLDDIACYGGLL